MSATMIDERDAQPPVTTTDVTRASKSTFARYGLTTLDVLLCFAVLIVMSAYTPFFHTWFWAPRMAIVLAAVLPGLLALWQLARNGDRAAQIAAAFLGWAAVATVFSDNPWLSFRGTILQSTFLLSYMAAFGLWALAQQLTSGGRRLMLWTVLVGAGLNAVAGALQMVLQLEGGNLGLSGGRALGLTPNPIELASFMLIGIFVCLELFAVESTRLRAAPAIGLFSFGAVLSFTSTRIAVAAFVVVAVWAVLRRRSRPHLVGAAIAATGVVAGVALTRIVSTGADVVARAAYGDRGQRMEWWLAGWQAFRDRPVLGWGAGRFRSAIQGELSFPYVAANQDKQAIPDAHNLIVNLAVDVGIPGLVLFLGFCWLAARRVSGTYRWAVAAVPIIWLFQPVAQTTMLLYMVLLGIAVTSRVDDGSSPVPTVSTTSAKSWVWTAATILGVAAASWLLVAEYLLAEATTNLDGDAFTVAEAMYFGDPIVSDLGARIWTGRSMLGLSDSSHILAQMEKSAELEPTRAYFQAVVGWELARLGDYEGAERRARRALDLQPTSALGWTTLMKIAEETDDERLRTEASQPLCQLGLGDCDAPSGNGAASPPS